MSETDVKTKEDLEAYIKAGETFQEKLSKAKKPFTLDMNLPAHISEMNSIVATEHDLYSQKMQMLLELKGNSDELYKKLEKYDTQGVYAEQRKLNNALFDCSIDCIKHLSVSQACLVEYSNAAIRFSSKTMRKDFKANLKDMIEEKFNNQLPQISELIYWMEEAGLKPIDRIKRTVSGYKASE